MPFEKGKSGNPSGRPKKGTCLTDILKEKGKEEVEFQGVKMTRNQALVMRVWKLALFDEVDLKVIKFIFERMDGMPVNIIDQMKIAKEEENTKLKKGIDELTEQFKKEEEKNKIKDFKKATG